MITGVRKNSKIPRAGTGTEAAKTQIAVKTSVPRRGKKLEGKNTVMGFMLQQGLDSQKGIP